MGCSHLSWIWLKAGWMSPVDIFSFEWGLRVNWKAATSTEKKTQSLRTCWSPSASQLPLSTSGFYPQSPELFHMLLTFLTFQACTATVVWGVIYLMVAAKISSLTVGYTLLDIIREAGRILSDFLPAKQDLQLCNATQVSSLLICKQGSPGGGGGAEGFSFEGSCQHCLNAAGRQMQNEIWWHEGEGGKWMKVENLKWKCEANLSFCCIIFFFGGMDH